MNPASGKESGGGGSASAAIFTAAPGIGDFVVRVPAVRMIARHYETTLIVTLPESARGFVESFFPGDGIRFRFTGKYQKSYRDRFLAFFGEVGRFWSFRDRYDAVFIMSDSNTLPGILKLTVLAGILRLRAAKFAIRPPRFLFPGARNLRIPEKIHKRARFLQFARQALLESGVDAGEVGAVPESAKERVEGGPVRITLVPGSKMPSRRWPYYEKLMRALAKRHAGAEFFVVGSPDEEALVRTVAGTYARALIGMSLAEVKDLLTRSDIVICNDSGLMHVSVWVGTETILLCGGEVFETWCDYREPHLHPLRHMVECYPCRLWECGHQSCLTGIDVERVLGEAGRILRARGLDSSGAAVPEAGRSAPSDHNQTPEPA